MADSDRERQACLQRFHDVKDELPTYYDLVLNTDALRVEQAVGAIVAVAAA